MQFKDVKISDKFINAESIANAFEILDTRLADMQLDNIQDLADITLALKEIIFRFGGKNTKCKITFSINSSFIDDKKSILLLQSLLSNSKNFKINLKKVS